LYESRNLAIHGLDNGEWNLSIWIYFNWSEDNKGEIQIFSFPHNYPNTIPVEDNSEVNIIKTIKLKPGIQINSVAWKENWFFVFDAISWDWTYSYFNWVWKEVFTDTEIEIEFSYWDSDTLKNTVTYFTLTNISDY
jgi:hypothetical protein